MTHAALDLDALIAHAAAVSQVDEAAARAVLIGALGLIEKHAAQEPALALYAAVPGAERAAASPEARPKGGGGLFGGLMKGAGGVSGAAIADGMGLKDRLKAQGIGSAELKRLLPAARDRVREATGRDLIGEAVRSIPGVGPLLGAD